MKKQKYTKDQYFLLVAQIIAHLSIIPMIIYGSWYHWLLGFGVYFITGCFGMTITYHRLLSHKSWNAPKWFEYFGSLAGTYGLTGSTIGWVAIHKEHHHYTDQEGDPHSPHLHDHGTGLRGIWAGFWHAHIGWIFDAPGEPLDRYVPDLIRDRRIRAISRLFPLWVAIGFVIPAILGGLANILIGEAFWTGAFLGFIWGRCSRTPFLSRLIVIGVDCII